MQGSGKFPHNSAFLCLILQVVNSEYFNKVKLSMVYKSENLINAITYQYKSFQ